MNNILQFLEENIDIKKSDSSTQLQVWNNAAFDGEDIKMKTSWSSSDCTKENLSPTAVNNSSFSKSSKQAKFNNQRNIDDEIAEIESEIRRLNSRLEALHLEKAERKIASEKRVGRIIAAKFMEPKRNAVVSFADDNAPKRNAVVFKDDTPKRNAVVSIDDNNASTKRNAAVFNTPKRNGVVSKDDTPRKTNWRRGMSLGPAEIASKIPPATTPGTQSRQKPRGMSLGPGEIASKIPPATTPATQNRRKPRGMSLGPAEISGRIPPVTTPATQNRRKSCLWKPQEEIDEHRRKTICKANTIGAIKSMKKKEEELIQPRNLFNEGETEKMGGVSSNKKGCMKQGRVVASRYNIGAVDIRKRSFPENKGGSEVKAKKRWEIPVEDVDVSGFVLLPKISTLKCVNESPRDSGAAKRVAELNGKKSFFSTDVEEGSGCQILSFDEDNDCEQG